MKKIIFATGNADKMKESSQILWKMAKHLKKMQ